MSNQNISLKSGIRDNLRRGTVYEFLEQEIKNGSVLSIVSAYFTINAFEALQEPLNQIENLRFLFGDPDFIKNLNPTNNEKKAFRLTDTGLELHKQLQQKPIAKACAEWIKEKVEIRSTRASNLLHGNLDLDDLSDGVVMSDFTLDYFFIQLLKYLERNKAELEATPKGAYAVTDNRDRPAETGVIFFIQQLNPATDTEQKTPSPIYSYYTVYIRKNGDIRYGCANTKQILDLFEATAGGKNEPLENLCLQFDQETQHGKNMGLYNKLLMTVIAHITRSHQKAQSRSIGRSVTRGFRLPVASETPKDSSDFELVTWLVITTTILIFYVRYGIIFQTLI